MSREWLRAFETACARYACRAVEDINTSSDENLWLSGPGGFWLTEISSVAFDEFGALVAGSRDALRRLGRNVLSNEDDPLAKSSTERRRRSRANHDIDGGLYYIADDESDIASSTIDIEIDFYISDATLAHDRCEQRRQCLIRVCRNYRVVRVMLLANTTRCGTISPAGLAFSRYPDRLRPFVLILMCELIARDINFEILNLHYEPLRSSEQWSTRRRNVQQPFDTRGCLEIMRDAHSRGRWLRFLPPSESPRHIRAIDDIVTERAQRSGRIRYAWRDAFVSRRSQQRYGTCSIAANTLLSLRDLEIELLEDGKRSCTLNLCDFTIFDRNTNILLLFDRDRLTLVRTGDKRTADYDDPLERRHFIDATGTLSSTLYTRFS